MFWNQFSSVTDNQCVIISFTSVADRSPSTTVSVSSVCQQNKHTASLTGGDKDTGSDVDRWSRCKGCDWWDRMRDVWGEKGDLRDRWDCSNEWARWDRLHVTGEEERQVSYLGVVFVRRTLLGDRHLSCLLLLLLLFIHLLLHLLLQHQHLLNYRVRKSVGQLF